MIKKISMVLMLTILFTSATQADENNNGSKMEMKKEFKECVAVELYTLSPKFVNKGNQPEETSKIPEGWTLVGGGGGGGHPTMIICR